MGEYVCARIIVFSKEMLRISLIKYVSESTFQTSYVQIQRTSTLYNVSTPFWKPIVVP